METKSDGVLYTSGTYGWTTCSTANDQQYVQQLHHQESIVNSLAAPLAICYCVTIVAIALTILVSLHIRRDCAVRMAISEATEREEAAKWKAKVEIAKTCSDEPEAA